MSPHHSRPPKSKSFNHRRNSLLLLLFLFASTFIGSILLLQHEPYRLVAQESVDQLVSAGKGATEWLSGLDLFGRPDVDEESDGRGRLGLANWEEIKQGWVDSVAKWLGVETVVEQPGCLDWDPKKDPSLDPTNCLKARQYRQVQVAIERESRAHHLSYEDTHQHVLASLKDMIHCFLPISDENFKICPEKPVILSEYPYSAEVWRNSTTGEVIWMESLVKQISILGYYILPVGPYHNWISFADIIPDVYTVLWAQDIIVITCISDPRCIAKEHYVPAEGSVDASIGVPDEERGTIPLWRLNVVDYWGSRPLHISNVDYWWNRTEDGEWSYHPLGQEWQATPWPLPDGHVHLPYSIEEYCLRLPVRPHKDRDDSVLLFAKLSRYFHRYDTPETLWSDLAKDPNFDLLTTAGTDDPESPIPEGVISLGKQQRVAYEELVGKVKVMVGVGYPLISPSVYTALCQATPVVIPHFDQKLSLRGWEIYGTRMQHGPAITIGEPYVYTYWLQNATELQQVIHRAMKTPISRFIPEDMTFGYAISKMHAYLSRDLESMFKAKIQANGGKIPTLYPGIKERCDELKRCYPPYPGGRVKVKPGVYLP